MLRKSQIFTLVMALFLTFLPQGVLAAPSDHTPYELQTSLITPDETHPYGSALLTFKIDSLPRSDSAANRYIVIEKKIGASGTWTGVTETSADEFLDYYQTSPGVFKYEQLWNEDYAWEAGTSISFRVKVALYDETFSLAGESGWSNIATIGVQGSGWAMQELEKAMDLGLIPVILSGQDLAQPITREEFCELTLLLYEKTTNKTLEPYSPNPFVDTSNPQILKAYALGITQGTSPTTFTPNKTISRQECATMLFQTIKAIAPKGDYSISGVPDFPDQKDIDSWAVEGTRYMSKLGIINGDERGYFMPKATTTAQQAAGYGTATREAAIIMSIRTYNVLH
ncbi:MAG: S-layer homology domain-containing protein [Syntrophomonadaceae bacterium]|nr:S-layer homology domain-containing protein [Syntrophomonadaceae bacterium]